MTKVILNDVASFQNDATAAAIVNANSATIETAFDNTLSRDGTAPNQMGSSLDMNSHRVLNLPAPISSAEPLRLGDANTLNGGGTIQSIPSGGNTGQVLTKNSNTSYDVAWSNGTVTSVGLAMPADFTITNSPVTSTGTLTASYTTPPTGSGAFVKATSPTLVTPVLGAATANSINKVAVTTPTTSATLTIADGKTLGVSNSLALTGTDGTTITFQGSDTYVGRASTDTLTNKTLTSPVISTIANTGTITLPTSTDTLVGKATTDILTNKTISTTGTGNHIQISGVDITRGQILGTGTNDSATTGNIGEKVSSNIVNASSVAMTSGVTANITSISLTAGDWDVWGTIFTKPAGTTTTNFLQAAISTTSATFPSDSSVSTSAAQIWMPNNGGSGTSTAGAGLILPITTATLSLSGTTTVYLVGACQFSVSTLGLFGNIIARRVR